MSQHTKGPWYWKVQDDRVMLGTEGRGFVFVMGFTRKGMQGAVPMFQVHRDGCEGSCRGCGVMVPATELADPRDHNGMGVLDHPDALLIASAPMLADECATLRAENARLRELVEGLAAKDPEDIEGDAENMNVDPCYTLASYVRSAQELVAALAATPDPQAGEMPPLCTKCGAHHWPANQCGDYRKPQTAPCSVCFGTLRDPASADGGCNSCGKTGEEPTDE